MLVKSIKDSAVFPYLFYLNLVFIKNKFLIFLIILKFSCLCLFADLVEINFNELLTMLKREDINVDFVNDRRFKIYYETPKLAKNLNKANYFEPAYGIFTEKSFKQSMDFLKKYENLLIKAEKNYKVPKEYIVSILQIETNFGRKKGERYVVNALVSMYVYGRKWAYKELKHFLSLSGTLYKDVFELKGSYAGAFGVAQMLPSSYSKFAVDFNDDGKIDPNCIEDAIGFVANYLNKCGFGESKESREKAIFSYNRQKSYVDAVIAYALKLKQMK